MNTIKSRAAVAFTPNEPLKIVEIDVERPKKVKSWSKSPTQACATQTPLPYQGLTPKGYSLWSWDTKGLAWS